MHVCCHLSHIWLFATLWTVAHQAPLSMGFSRQEYWSGLPCPPPGDFPNTGWNPHLFCLLHWQSGSLPLAPPGKPSNETLWLPISLFVCFLNRRSCLFFKLIFGYTGSLLLHVAFLWFQQADSVIVAHGLSCLAEYGIFKPRDQTCVLCTGRWILNHWPTREAQWA